MFRKSLLASALFLALLPNAGWALGLGGIHTESALNEPFVGQIDLLDVPLDQLDTVKVLLASDAEFSKVGADRSYFLTKLKFQPQVSSQGRAVIRVTSSDPVREPFLDFLVDVNWPKGRLVKEYTVLLDPPVTMQRRPPRVNRPAVQRPPQPIQRSATAPSVTLSRPPASVDNSIFPVRHGPIAPGAGLWQIARRMSPTTGATVAQTAMALYRNNQAAFIGGDINKLKVNETLEIPSASELFALDAGAAEQEFRAALRGERVTATPLTDITTARRQQDRLQIAGSAKPPPAAQITDRTASQPAARVPSEETQAKESTAEPASQAPLGQATGQISETPAAGESTPELGAIKEDLLLVQEAGESTRQETEELRERIRELESQLTDIQKLLALSNERFAQLQQSGSDQLGTTTSKPVETLPAAEAPEDQKQAQPTSPKTEVAQPSDKTASPSTPAPDSAAKESTPGTGGSFLGSIAQSPWIWAALLVPLLLFLAWMAYRRRKSLEDILSPGELAFETPVAASTDAITPTPMAEQEAVSTPVSSTSSSLSEELSQMEDETDEADVISEADVYIAYGRYREAEALLEEHARTSPDRPDIKYKLAEAYYGAQHAEQMEALMTQMQQAGSDRMNPNRWQRLVNLLGELKGTGTVEAFAPSGGNGNLAPEDLEPRSPQEAAVPPPLPPSAERPGESDTGELDKLASRFDDVPTASGEAQALLGLQDEPTQDLELDIDDLDFAGDELEASASDKAGEIPSGTSDYELQLDDLETLKDLDLALSESGSSLETEPQGAPDEDMLDSDIESLDVSLIDDDSLEGDISAPEWEIDSSMWDEAATKIDLARAYMEMEDLEAARVILEEVVQEGNESQQAEARELMAQLS